MSGSEKAKRLLAFYKLNKKESFRVESAMHCGSIVLSIRRYKSDADGNERAVSCGLAFSADKLDEVSALLIQARDSLASTGGKS